MLDAIERIAAFGIYGVVWLDRVLNVEKTYGTLVDFVASGAPVTDSIVALFGLEGEILAMRDRPDRVLELPAVGVPDADGKSRRLNFTLFWQTDTDTPMMLVYRVKSQTEIEYELSRQIRARLMAEGTVSAKSKELARANADLESFAAIVSHDLKAPLRHMRQLADTLITETTIAKSDEALSRLMQVQSLSRRMSHMLTELLDYASLGRKYEALVETDTGALVAQIVASMPASGCNIAISGSWPVLATLAAPLDLILRNLVQNAIQHHDREHGAIAIACQDRPHEIVISVADDGPGIPPEYHAAAFLPFRTLGAKNGQGGTGIGLAMVKKVVETAGGGISVTSDAPRTRGTTFIVTWPKLIRA